MDTINSKQNYVLLKLPSVLINANILLMSAQDFAYFHSLALPSDEFTVQSSIGFDAIQRALTALTTQQGVVVESLILTHITGWFDCLRRADTASRHLVTQSATTFTCCRRDKGFY